MKWLRCSLYKGKSDSLEFGVLQFRAAFRLWLKRLPKGEVVAADGEGKSESLEFGVLQFGAAFRL
jgi:hypothetical protein